jgi:hypothetical protein
MAISLKRKLYVRGGSFETTIPMQLLFSIDTDKKNNVVFEFDKETKRWYIDIIEDKQPDLNSTSIKKQKNKK